LDDPLQGLDPRTQLWLTKLLQELGIAGKTIITATHDLELVDQISKRALVRGEDHRIAMDRNVEKVLNNLELLLASNLIHEHMHIHGKLVHEHLHQAHDEHIHRHGN
jgi:cobalt/nickel transport system ATP-binding protein